IHDCHPRILKPRGISHRCRTMGLKYLRTQPPGCALLHIILHNPLQPAKKPARRSQRTAAKAIAWPKRMEETSAVEISNQVKGTLIAHQSVQILRHPSQSVAVFIRRMDQDRMEE